MQLVITLTQKLALLNSLAECELQDSEVLKKNLDVLKDIALSLVEEIEVLSYRQTLNVSQRISLPDELRRFERHFIQWALKRTGGHQKDAAKLLGMKATTLNRKLKQFGISADNSGTPRRRSSENSAGLYRQENRMIPHQQDFIDGIAKRE